MILGIVFGVIGAVILLIFVYLLWRRRQRKTVATSSENTPLVPRPISVKQFPKHYHDVKENLNKLKAEYSLIGSLSSEDAPTCYNAKLLTNKRKNRYTDILPCKCIELQIIYLLPFALNYLLLKILRC